MVEFKTSMKKEELLDVAAANGIAADDSMTKTQIIEALNAHNAKETAGKPAEGATEGAENAAGGEGGAGSETEHDASCAVLDGNGVGEIEFVEIGGDV